MGGFYTMMGTCEKCGYETDHLNEADYCEDCHEKWVQEQIAYWKPLYDGEKIAGLHSGLSIEDMRRLK